MFENKQFYHGTTRKVITAFGTLFDSIYIRRDDNTNLKVGLSYAPTEHFIQVLNKKDRDDKERINQLLPRMSFSFGSPVYDSEREVDISEKLSCVDSNGAKWMFSPVPYKYTVTLNIWTKYIDDMYEITEQILPYFRPDFSVTIIDNSDMGINQDVTFELLSVDDEDTYESNLTDKRMFVSTLTFTASLNFYPPIEDGVVIKQAIVSLHPTINIDEPILKEKYTATVDPWEAFPGDPFNIIEVHTLE